LTVCPVGHHTSFHVYTSSIRPVLDVIF